MLATSKISPWRAYGNGLYRRGQAYFIRVRVPRDLREGYKSEICESLKTSDRREGERRCRERRVEIDREFKRRRKAKTEAGGRLDSRELDRIAQQLYRSEVADGAEAMHDHMMRDPDAVELGLDEELHDWAFGLEEGVWSRRQNEMVTALLEAAGATIPRDDPLFPEARDKIARAIVHTNRNLAARTRGEDYRPADPLFTAAPPSPAAPEGITLGELIARYEKDRGAGWSGKTRDGYVLIYRSLKELLGEHTAAASINREDCRRVREILADLAPNYTKLRSTRGRTMEEAAKISRELNLPRLKPESVNSYLNNLAALMNYADAGDVDQEAGSARPVHHRAVAADLRPRGATVSAWGATRGSWGALLGAPAVAVDRDAA
jgi:hypothetical protein